MFDWAEIVSAVQAAGGAPRAPVPLTMHSTCLTFSVRRCAWCAGGGQLSTCRPGGPVTRGGLSEMATIEQDLLARIDTAILWQPFVERVNTTLNAAAARGRRYAGIAGFRPREDQDALYAIGRTTGKPGHIVTQLKGGQSRHQHYCAIDFALDSDPNMPGLQPDYTDEHYRTLAEEAVRAGLEAGFYWNHEGQIGFSDPPHLEAPVRRWGITADLLERALAARGRDGVIALLDSLARW